MADKNLLRRISKWREKIGRERAEAKLLKVGLSLSMTQKLLAGVYPDTPKADKVKMIERAMK